MSVELAREIERLWEAPPQEAAGGLGAVEEAIALLDAGAVRVAERGPDGWAPAETEAATKIPRSLNLLIVIPLEPFWCQNDPLWLRIYCRMQMPNFR